MPPDSNSTNELVNAISARVLNSSTNAGTLYMASGTVASGTIGPTFEIPAAFSQLLNNGPSRWIPAFPVTKPKKETQEEMGVHLANKFKLGCDPEFVVLNNEGEIVNVANQMEHHGVVGWDHGGAVVELRPSPSRGTYALVKRLQEIIKEDAKHLHKYRWRGGAYYKTVRRTAYLGGHVHLGFEPFGDQIVHVYDPLEKKQKEKDYNLLIKACDRVTKTLEKLDILPTSESRTRRMESGYGTFGDVRSCPNDDGEKRHIEYRSMASWLYDPKTAYLVLTAIKQAGVSPSDAIALLGTQPSWPKLKQFFEAFSEKDDNSARVVENVLSKGHKALVADPDADPKEAWQKLRF